MPCHNKGQFQNYDQIIASVLQILFLLSQLIASEGYDYDAMLDLWLQRRPLLTVKINWWLQIEANM